VTKAVRFFAGAFPTLLKLSGRFAAAMKNQRAHLRGTVHFHRSHLSPPFDDFRQLAVERNGSRHSVFADGRWNL